MANHKIEIIPGDPPTVDKDDQNIHKKDDDRVKWESKETKDWAVVFEGDTPFDLHYFTPCSSDSGAIRPDAEEKEYKYTIFVNGKESDPILIVN